MDIPSFGKRYHGCKKGVPSDGNLTAANGKDKWWEKYDLRLLYGINLSEYRGVAEKSHTPWSPPSPEILVDTWNIRIGMQNNGMAYDGCG